MCMHVYVCVCLCMQVYRPTYVYLCFPVYACVCMTSRVCLPMYVGPVCLSDVARGGPRGPCTPAFVECFFHQLLYVVMLF